MTSSLQDSLGSHTDAQWADDFLTAINAPVNQPNGAASALIAWEHLESGGGGGQYNPWNSTLAWPGASNVNSAGVKNYASYSDGIAASAQTFSSGVWANLANLLRSGNASFAQIANEVNSVGGAWGATWPLSSWQSASAGPQNDPGAALPSAPVPIPGGSALGIDTSGQVGGCPEGNVFSLKAPGSGLPLVGSLAPSLTLTKCEGRALLGAACLVAGAVLLVGGLAVMGLSSRAGRGAAQLVGTVAKAA